MGAGLAALEAALGYSFSDASLLAAALTHTSFVKGDGKCAPHNERLEFLGDAVLELCVSDHLYRSRPAMQEGEMTRARARLVCEESLFSVGCALGLPSCLRLGNGEEVTGGRQKPSIVSDALEAVIGAVYLDGGLEATCRVVMHTVLALLEDACGDAAGRDYKTRLQEYVQRERLGELRYVQTDEAGPEHYKTFTMSVLLSDQVIGTGAGRTKRGAGQEAAKRALAALSADTGGE